MPRLPPHAPPSTASPRHWQSPPLRPSLTAKASSVMAATPPPPPSHIARAVAPCPHPPPRLPVPKNPRALMTRMTSLVMGPSNWLATRAHCPDPPYAPPPPPPPRPAHAKRHAPSGSESRPRGLPETVGGARRRAATSVNRRLTCTPSVGLTATLATSARPPSQPPSLFVSAPSLVVLPLLAPGVRVVASLHPPDTGVCLSVCFVFVHLCMDVWWRCETGRRNYPLLIRVLG